MTISSSKIMAPRLRLGLFSIELVVLILSGAHWQALRVLPDPVKVVPIVGSGPGQSGLRISEGE